MKKTAIIILTAILAAALATGFLIYLRCNECVYTPCTVSVYFRQRGEIAIMPYDEYVLGRALAQMPANSETEALAAAACAISSTALSHTGAGLDGLGADFTDDEPLLYSEELCAAFDGSERLEERAKSAVRKGISQALTIDGAPVYAPTCAISAGNTEDISTLYPWISACKCEKDKNAAGYESSTAMTAGMVSKAIKKIAPNAVLRGNGAEWFSEPVYSDAGTLCSISFGGSAISGTELRTALGLRSTAISVSFEEDKFVFRCKGYGDNVGMSLYTANEMALRGASMEEILDYFYTGAKLIKTAPESAR